jgi:hypothetical protein
MTSTTQNQPGGNLYGIGVGSRPENVEVPHLDVRAPAQTDVNYPVGKRWVDTVGNAEYVLTSFTSSAGTVTANWQGDAGGSVTVETLTGDSGGAIHPSGGNITLAGTSHQITTTGSGSTITYSLTGPYTPATYTAHGVLIGEGTGSIVAASVGSTGQVLIGSTGADPAFGNLGVNSNLTGLVLGNTNSAFTATSYTAAGSFTPAFSLTAAGDSAWTYSAQNGRYTRLGAVVYFVAELVWTNFTNSTGSGNWFVNLPVTAGAFAVAGQVAISGSGIDMNAETLNLPANFLGVIGTGATKVLIACQEGGSTNSSSAIFNTTVAQVLTTGTLNISGFYFAA